MKVESTLLLDPEVSPVPETTTGPDLAAEEPERAEPAVYREIDRRVGVVNEVYDFLMQEGQKDPVAFLASLREFQNIILTRQPAEIQEGVRHLQDLNSGIQPEGDPLEDATTFSELLSHSPATFPFLLDTSLRRIGQQAEALAKLEHQHLYRAFESILKREIGPQLMPEDCEIEMHGFYVLINLRKPLLPEESLAFAVSHTPVVVVDRAKIREKRYDFTETVKHELTHLLTDYLYSGNRFSANRLEKALRKSATAHWAGEADPAVEQVIQEQQDNFYLMSAEELISDRYLEPGIVMEKITVSDLVGYLETRWKEYVEYLGAEHPLSRRHLESAFSQYAHLAEKLARAVFVLLHEGREDYVLGLHAQFSLGKSRLWEATARHVIGRKRYQQILNEDAQRTQVTHTHESDHL